jgi:hypothetical protein
MAFAQLVHGHFELLLLDVIVLLVLGASWQSLPRQAASKEVKQHVADRL